MTSNDAVVVVATIQAAEGSEDKVEQAIRAAIPAVHAEPGCLKYALHRDLRSPGTFVMIEKWASAEALGVHGKGAALRELGAALDGLLSKPLSVQTLAALPEGDGDLGRV
ncbi:putative quinol monooxygenase [Amycolatopsis cynarae]|uniref:Quinol monooxygenase n=1 Tax=Amycolatopsis cynarae TaxID=2995223 RepID=A0ABY7BEG9_9PSEU|nr:putative quinol monooxygenase [Amycolatopsis sp. HUAS 11-8]WAL69301.1 putative quinol monooxygenase [Amycolatopsis sp. HUAS 11-8]